LHIDAVLVAQDRDADAVELRVLFFFQAREVCGREEGRVRVERREHALNRSLIRLLVVNLVGVIVCDERERLLIIALNIHVRVALSAGCAVRAQTPAQRAAKYARQRDEHHAEQQTNLSPSKQNSNPHIQRLTDSSWGNGTLKS